MEARPTVEQHDILLQDEEKETNENTEDALHVLLQHEKEQDEEEATASGEPIKQKIHAQDENPHLMMPELSLQEQVEAKEECLKEQVALLLNFLHELTDGDKDPPEELQDWYVAAEQLIRDVQSFHFKVGVAGDTGMGKTSLLNTLVGGITSVTPESQNGACTAAVCCFRYNKSTDPKEKFRAKVTFKSQQTMLLELSGFFDEYRDVQYQTDREGLLDMSVQGELDRLEAHLDLIVNWSGLEKEFVRQAGLNGLYLDILEKSKAKECLKGSNITSQTTYTLACDSATKFLNTLRPFVGSGARTRGRQLWPLVERVDVFVVADILRNGIQLVDLPGEMDALEARSQVARNYYNNLDALMVTTPSDRALDNRTATDLIREDQVVDFEAKGQMDGDTLCVVVTKVDQMQWTDFVDRDMQATDISPDFPDHYAEYMKIEQDIAELTESGTPCADKELVEKLQRKLATLDATCNLLCIEARSNDVRLAFQEYFDKIRNSMRARTARRVTTSLSVFPVTTKAQRALLKGKPMPSFVDGSSTGFVPLERWIRGASIAKRSRRVDSMLYRCIGLFQAVQALFYADEAPPVRLEKKDFNHSKCIVEGLIKVLQESLKKTKTNLVNSSRRWKAKVFEPQKSSAERLESDFVPFVKNFSLQADRKTKLNWRTYDACVRRNGGIFRSHTKPKKTHYWQGKIFAYYWATRAAVWGQTFHQQLPKYMKSRVRQAGRMIIGHHNWLVRNSTLPKAYKVALKDREYQLEHCINQYQTVVNELTVEFQDCARDIQQKSKGFIEGTLKSWCAGVMAKQVSGKGRFKAQQKAVEEGAEQIKEHIFYRIDQDVQKGIKDGRSQLMVRFQSLTDEIIKKIKKHELDIAEALYSGVNKKKRCKKSSGPAPVAVALQNLTQDCCNRSQESWERLKEKIPSLKLQQVDQKMMDEFEALANVADVEQDEDDPKPARQKRKATGEEPKKQIKRGRKNQKHQPADCVMEDPSNCNGTDSACEKAIQRANDVVGPKGSTSPLEEKSNEGLKHSLGQDGSDEDGVSAPLGNPGQLDGSEEDNGCT